MRQVGRRSRVYAQGFFDGLFGVAGAVARQLRQAENVVGISKFRRNFDGRFGFFDSLVCLSLRGQRCGQHRVCQGCIGIFRQSFAEFSFS
jgi:hypothetical protein